jgi:hypothetical protein
MKKDIISYETPIITVVEMKQEGVICQSLTDPADYIEGTDPFESITL